ncbi:M16 family metallopeptidase [Propionibacteriaceae bacterium Y1700]|uniref:M16 family metallopeptidase n=1 Tax=Microlunatus sp. Y1700 TaxID=3418487 RepID=UPI003DA73EC4
MSAALSYPIAEHTLDNGLRVIISPDSATPTVAINLWYDVGSRHEEPGRTGFAHLFEHLMFQGSAGVRSGEHIEVLQANGASVNATTWFDRTNYFEALPAGGLDLALWLEADRMSTLAVTAENFETQREVVKEEKRQRYDNVPYGDVMERLVALTFPAAHPYGHTTIGSMADLDAAELTDVQAFYRRFYMPDNAVLSVVGAVDVEAGLAAVEKFFGHIPAGGAPEKLITEPLPAISGLPREETTADVPADAIHFSWRLPARATPEFDACDLAMTVLGHGQTSRVQQALVRRGELAESAGASTMALIGGNSFGLAQARARDGVSIEQVEQAYLTELDRLATDGPTDEELTRAKATFERYWLQSLASVDSRADALSNHALIEGDPQVINTRIAAINAIDADTVRAATAAHLTADRRATLIHRKENR